jgi:hypothetical protein
MEDTVYIVEEIRDVVNSIVFDIPVYYLYGHPKEITKRLQEYTESFTSSNKKFPLIVLFTDITVNRDKRRTDIYGKAKLRILIANITEGEYISEQRTAINFKPILHPIKSLFIEQMERHKQFTFDWVEFSETECYFYGTEMNDKNIFNDRVDAIEISNLNVIIKNNNCFTAKTNF